jgi:hypothetical protein
LPVASIDEVTMTFFLTDDAFVRSCLDRLADSGVPILELHRAEDFPPEAVLIEMEHFKELLRLIPESERATELVMNHDHVEGDG